MAGWSKQNQSFAALAKQLGLERSEWSVGDSSPIASPVLFPPLKSHPLPIEPSEEDANMARWLTAFTNRCRQSRYYVTAKQALAEDEDPATQPIDDEDGQAVRDWRRIPMELLPKARYAAALEASSNKRQADDKDTMENVLIKFEQLEKSEEQRRKRLKPEDETEIEGEVKDEDEEEKGSDEEKPPLSDDDYLEEDNDYIESYFDNGEAYLEESDDNLEDEDAIL